MRQGTGHPAEQRKVFLTGLVNPCTMDFVSAKGSTLGPVIYCHPGCMNYFILAKIGKRNMKKTFQKTLIAASVGIVMLSAAGTASANSLLFPYFTTVAGAQSVLTLTNTATTGTVGSANALHYVYNYGSSCTHYDATGSMTTNDVLSHSIASPTTAGGFGKVTSTDTSTPVYFPNNDTGFLVVSSKTTSGDDLRGSMAIVDTNSGLVVSYAPINNALDTNAANNEGNFSAITDVKFALNFMPTGYVTTSWFGSVVGNMNTAITTGANWGGVATFTNNGNVYNNDEVAYSGTTTKAITCSGSITPGNLMTSAQLTAVGTNGGLVNATATMTVGGTGVVMMKMQTVLPAVGAPFAGKQFMHREVAGAF